MIRIPILVRDHLYIEISVLYEDRIDGSVQKVPVYGWLTAGLCISCAFVLEVPQSCTKPLCVHNGEMYLLQLAIRHHLTRKKKQS